MKIDGIVVGDKIEYGYDSNIVSFYANESIWVDNVNAEEFNHEIYAGNNITYNIFKFKDTEENRVLAAIIKDLYEKIYDLNNKVESLEEDTARLDRYNNSSF